MGVTLSKNASLAPVSLASTIIGFISFAFTVSTFLRVFWSNIMTIMDAEHEIPDLLGNVKQELYEEKSYLRTVRRRRQAQNPDDMSLRVLDKGVRNMFTEFKNLERQFLLHPHEHWEPYGYDDGGEKRGGGGDGGGRWERDRGYTDEDDYLNTEYKNVNLFERVAWLRTRGGVISIAERLSRVQTRRIARQTTAISGDTRYVCQMIQELDDRVYALEQKLSNIVGVRRVT